MATFFETFEKNWSTFIPTSGHTAGRQVKKTRAHQDEEDECYQMVKLFFKFGHLQQ